MLIYIHGEGRRFQYLLQNLEELASDANYLIVCPLFPANILRDGNVEGYKYLAEEDLRYDQVLLDIVEEIRSTYIFQDDRFLLGGFSGGGQFCNRFYYLYPELIRAVSIAAPGSVTLLDETLPWWPGTGSVPSFFGREVNREALKSVDVQLLVGTHDTDNRGVRFGPSSRYWSPLANVAGSNRFERLLRLNDSLLASDIRTRLDLAPNAGHSFRDLLPFIADFFCGFAKPPPQPDAPTAEPPQ